MCNTVERIFQYLYTYMYFFVSLLCGNVGMCNSVCDLILFFYFFKLFCVNAYLLIVCV